MKLYYHPVSTTSRPLVLFAAENKVALDLQVVDLMTGEHYKPEYEAINPNHLVPLLEDGKFRLSESSAILKYLADKVDSPLYPKDLQARARVNERMDWINTQLNRELCYGVVYPQVFAHHKRPGEETQSATLQWGKERAQGWLKILDENILGKDNRFLCGDTMTIADYFGAGFVSAGEIVGCDYAAYPNVQGWLARMKALKSWKQVHEIFDGWTASLKGKPMVTA